MTQSPTRPSYDNRILESLRIIIRSVEMYSKQLSSKYNITGPQLSCLLMVGQQQPITASRIARSIHLSASTVVGVLDRLEEKKLIARQRDEHDRRKIYVSLTPSGEEVVRESPPPLQEKLLRALADLSELEQSTIALSLERIAALVNEPLTRSTRKKQA